MKRVLLAVFLLAGCALPSVVVYPRVDKATCRKGCSDDYSACMSNTDATDKEQARARRNACSERYSRCLSNCE